MWRTAINRLIPGLRLRSSSCWLNPPVYPVVVPDITNVSVHIQLKHRHIPDRSYRRDDSCCFCFLPLPVSRSVTWCPCGWYTKRKRGRGGEQSRSRLCPTVSCRVCCCFAEGLWEVLALRGQQRTPPSSCFDRHPALTQTFSLFHFIWGPSNQPLPRSYKTGLNAELELDYLIILRYVLWMGSLWWTWGITGNMLRFIWWLNLWTECPLVLYILYIWLKWKNEPVFLIS